MTLPGDDQGLSQSTAAVNAGTATGAENPSGQKPSTTVDEKALEARLARQERKHRAQLEQARQQTAEQLSAEHQKQLESLQAELEGFRTREASWAADRREFAINKLLRKEGYRLTEESTPYVFADLEDLLLVDDEGKVKPVGDTGRSVKDTLKSYFSTRQMFLAPIPLQGGGSNTSLDVSAPPQRERNALGFAATTPQEKRAALSKLRRLG